MWKAVVQNDAAFDGQFFYAVNSTGIFCRPSCHSRVPSRGNVRYFATAQEARAAGFRPCKRCRSDLPAYHPDREAAEEIRQFIDGCWQYPDRLEAGWRTLGLSRHRAGELFRDAFGLTIGSYIEQRRFRFVIDRLAGTHQPVVDIACEAGFGSLSAFYRFFRKHAGQSPAVYRREHQR